MWRAASTLALALAMVAVPMSPAATGTLRGLAGVSTAEGGARPMPSNADDRTRAAVEALNAAVNAHDLSALHLAVTDDVVFENTNPAPDGTRIEGRDAFGRFWAQWFAANPDARFEVEELVAAGDRAVVRWVYRKTRDGRPWHIRGIDLFRVRDGRIAEKLSYVKG